MQLLHSKRQRVREILHTKKREQEAREELSDCSRRYKALQTDYQQIEASLQRALATSQDDA